MEITPIKPKAPRKPKQLQSTPDQAPAPQPIPKAERGRKPKAATKSIQALPFQGWTIQTGFDMMTCEPEGDETSFRESCYPYLDPEILRAELEKHLSLEFPGATIQIDITPSPDDGKVRTAAIDPSGDEWTETTVSLEDELDLWWTLRFPQIQAEFGEALDSDFCETDNISKEHLTEPSYFSLKPEPSAAELIPTFVPFTDGRVKYNSQLALDLEIPIDSKPKVGQIQLLGILTYTVTQNGQTTYHDSLGEALAVL